MTLNKDQAQHERDRQYDDAVQAEIRDILASDGDQFCGQVARKIGKTEKETRWHLDELRSRGEIGYKWAKGMYSI